MNQIEESSEYVELFKAYDLADDIIQKNYLHRLSSCEIVPCEKTQLKLYEDISDVIRLFKITEIIIQDKKTINDRLATVYSSIGNCESDIIIIIDSDGNDMGNVDFYIGVKNEKSIQSLNMASVTLEKSFRGNFPGSKITEIRGKKVKEFSDNIFLEGTGVVPNVSLVSGIAEEKENVNINDEKTSNIENYINAMKGTAYTAIFIAKHKNIRDIINLKESYEELYTNLYPLSKRQVNCGGGVSHSINSSLSSGITESITHGQSYSTGQSSSNGSSSSKTKSKGTNSGLSFFVNFGGNSSKGESDSVNQSITDSFQEGTSESDTKSKNEQNTTGQTSGSSTTYSIQMEMENKRATSLIEKINSNLKRFEKIDPTNAFEYGAYFIASTPEESKIAANTYKALALKKCISIDIGVINTWNDKNKNNELCTYLKQFLHPIFDIEKNGTLYTGTSIVSAVELSKNITIPMQSVAGVDILMHEPFGRNINQKENGNCINVGKLNYLGEQSTVDVLLDVNSLASHTFITGSTGMGKTNTVCLLVSELEKRDVKFLIIEPTKGEYKDFFGNKKGVNVFGTNSNETEIIKLNPFSFPNNISVLEHIDRITEIFNACWPMYAAMPAILKQAIERSYAFVGWDLNTSKSKYEKYGFRLYPDFEIVLAQIEYILNHSAFSSDNKGDYVGALCTRVSSLTNGIFKKIFISGEDQTEKIFNENTIIDISRLFTNDSKALIMGLLVMKLQECRISEKGAFNSNLRHVTVLEEAHNLLKRTSIEQSDESGNLLGKSVEMITNAIAEMRTYGEGFIIADQAPALLDAAVIRNTNTKIIHKLPEKDDRDIAGHSVALNDKQIVEIAKMDTGQAVIYQNGWNTAVLCNVAKLKKENYKFYYPGNYDYQDYEIRNELLWWSLCDFSYHIENIEKKIYLAELKVETKIQMLRLINFQKSIKLREMIAIIEFLDLQMFERYEFLLDDVNDYEEWFQEIQNEFYSIHDINDSQLLNRILIILTKKLEDIYGDGRYEKVMNTLIDKEAAYD